MGTRKKIPKKKRTTKKVVKKKPKRIGIRTPTAIDHNVRACIAEEIALAKGKKRLSKKEKRMLFDRAFAKCIRQSH
jgi:hypothetical protein